ncbi:hypothetical protein KC340_g5428 [Hortaea werneckii]|nr:hypothetical protein KC342_g9875 [Hortaea werneckii]KAI7094294.1 hypothetical protein KC339_g11666 [Hortaea werneckii]KAI7233121.1 hypothetical protein KC365_g6493 [Hortaea werneckii]KAI7327829.1 hypothetical protein KC340_g5428 [Hortaea werneckii]KAI7377204.1 hypothetical protein KC328_g14535 [Hortaea werneckii]
MDHSHHNHGGMDMGDGGGDSPMCSMNMLFTWDTNNLCIVFSQWRVTGTFSLVISILAVMALTAGYEAIRETSRNYEARQAERIESSPRNTAEAEEKKGKVVKAALYGIQVFYSFFIMLLFMTYNGWIMLAVGFGAFFGYLIFGQASIDKSAACH